MPEVDKGIKTRDIWHTSTMRLSDQLRPFAPGMRKFVVVTFCLWSVGATLMVNSVVALSLLMTYAAILIKMYEVHVEPVFLLMTHSLISTCMFYDSTSTVCFVTALVTSFHCFGVNILHGDRLTVVVVAVLIPGLMHKPQAILACVVIALVIAVSKLRPVRPHSLLLTSLTFIALTLLISRAAGSVLIFLLMGIVTTLFVANKTATAAAKPNTETTHTDHTHTDHTHTDHTHASITPIETDSTADAVKEHVDSIDIDIENSVEIKTELNNRMDDATIEAASDDMPDTIEPLTDDGGTAAAVDGNTSDGGSGDGSDDGGDGGDDDDGGNEVDDNEVIGISVDGDTTGEVTQTDHVPIETSSDGNAIDLIVATPDEDATTNATDDESAIPTEIQVSRDDDLPLDIEPKAHRWHNINNNNNSDDDGDDNENCYNKKQLSNYDSKCGKSEICNGAVPNGYLQMSCTTDSLDLQGHTVSGAIKVLIAYLRECEDVYRENRTNHLRHVTIVTGEGDVTATSNDVNFDPEFAEFHDLELELDDPAGSGTQLLIKPTVVHFLTINKYRYEIPTDTPGLVKVDLESHMS